MKQFCGTSDCAMDQSPTTTASATTTSLDDVEQSSPTIPPTSDPLNVAGQVGGVVISVMIASGVIGNVLVLTAIIHCPQLRRSYNAFIASLSVTDLIFNVTVMPFYVDSYFHRGWRFSEAVCRWHTYFGTIVIVSSSLHIALIASSRYHLIVHPRFYARWLSSGAAVVSQIAFVWLVAVALVLPGIIDVLPTVIGYSDQLSRCSYDRVESYGALSFLFCTGFIVPCVVMGYCYAMIWRRTREVGMRVDGYGAVRLLKMRQQNGDLAVAGNSPPPCTPCVNVQETARSEPLPNADDDGQLHVTAEDDKITAGSEQLPDKSRLTDCVMEHPQGTTADCPDRLLSTVDKETISVAIDQLSAVQSSPATSERRNVANSSSCDDSINDNDDDDDNTQAANTDERRPWINSDDYQQLATTLLSVSNSGKLESSLSEPSVSTRSSSHAVERREAALDDHVTNGSVDRPAANKVKELEDPAAKTQTLKRDSIKVVVSPATAASSSAATVLRESPTKVIISDVMGRNHCEVDGHVQPLVESDDTRLSVKHRQLTQHSAVISPFRRRLAGGDVGENSPPTRLPSPTCHRHRSHSLHMILAVFFAFVLTYLPFTITNLADQQAILDRNVYMMTSLAFWAGSCINPLIYGIMNVQFRRAYVSIVVNCWRHSLARCQTL